MNLAPTDEQRALRTTAREFLAARVPIDRVVTLSDVAWDAKVWSEIAELGWTSVSIPESLGGLEMGLVEESIVAEEAAAALLPAPWLSTIGLALPALLAGAADDEVAAIASGELRATVAWAESGGGHRLSEAPTARLAATATGDGWELNGTKTWVPDADRVDLIVVVAHGADGVGLFACRADEVIIQRLDTVDRTRPLSRLDFAGVRARRVVGPGESAAVLERLWQRAVTLASAEAVGIAQRVLDVSVEYAKVRSQFGRPIGTYQAVSHQLVDTYVELELSRSLMTWAALSVDANAPAASVAVAAAAASAIPRAVTACERAIQIHAGIGTTWESSLHRYYKRAMALAALDGPPSRHRSRVRPAFAAVATLERERRSPSRPGD